MDDNPWKNWCTLYTDASYSNAEKAGWGIWLRHSKPPERIKNWGSCAGVQDSNVAEMIAIIRGVEIAIKNWPDLEGIGVKSDSRVALGWAKYGAELHRRQDIRALQIYLRNLLEEYEVKIKCRWVRGHQYTGTTEGWLNDAVDGFSRRDTSVNSSSYPRLLNGRRPPILTPKRVTPALEEAVPIEIPGEVLATSPNRALKIVLL